MAYNLDASCPASCCAGWPRTWLVRGLGSGALAAWIAAVAFALCPFRIDHLSHLELQMASGCRSSCLAIARPAVLEVRRRYGVVLVLALAAQWYSSMYYGSLPHALCRCVCGRARIAIEGRRRAESRTALAAVLVAAVLVLPLVRAYLASHPARGDRSHRTISGSSVPSRPITSGPGVAVAVYRGLSATV